MDESDAYDLERVVREHGNAVWRLIVRVLGDDGHDAADCFQQAFVEFAARHRQLNDIHNPAPLLKRIAVTRAIDTVRRRIRQRGRSQELSANLVATRSAKEPDTEVQAAELLDDLRAALSELPALQSAAFVLMQIDHLPRDQAAKSLGISVNHLSVLLHRAGAALRQRLESHRPSAE
jgi:RNA polymerase sigma-70 factor (ECF subfamily)